MKCTRCGNENTSNTNFCPFCGASMKDIEQNINATDTQPYQSEKKKDSTMSIVSCVLGGVAFILPMPIILALPLLLAGMIVGLIDVAKGDKTQRHIGSGFAIAVCAIAFFVMFLR